MKIGVFAGTTEGRLLIDYLGKTNAVVTCFVATNEGKEVLNDYPNVEVLIGRKTKEEMIDAFTELKLEYIMDATHPYAQVVSNNIEEACDFLSIPYVRIERDCKNLTDSFSTNLEVVDFLNKHEGNILLTTGSKDLDTYAKIQNFEKRVYVRLLPTESSIKLATDAGFDMSHIIAMKGPFSTLLNEALIKNLNIAYCVSKNSGKEGGFYEKIESCKNTGAKLLVIGKEEQVNGLSLNQAILNLSNLLTIKKKIHIIGLGPGNEDLETVEVKKMINETDCLIGAKSRIEDYLVANKYYEYKSEAIVSFIKNSSYSNYVVAYSGDTGFYSGTKKLVEALKDYEVTIHPGISSFSYLCSKLKLSYENVKLLSLHGRNSNEILNIAKNEYTFLLTDISSLHALLNNLVEYEMDDCLIYIGENLSYPNERIMIDHPSKLMNLSFSSLTSVIVYNPYFNNKITYGICDEEFIKEKSPMTKMEARSVSLSKLALTKDAIVYDVGAGTGSVSVEMARLVEDGIVYAIEKDEDAVSSLKKNKKKFKTSNLNIIQGTAPKVLENLPTPTHVFIGGTSGNLKEIVNTLLKKNEHVRLVLNAVSLDTITEAFSVFNELKMLQEVITLNASRSKEIGSYHLMMGQNPITIFVAYK